MRCVSAPPETIFLKWEMNFTKCVLRTQIHVGATLPMTAARLPWGATPGDHRHRNASGIDHKKGENSDVMISMT